MRIRCALFLLPALSFFSFPLLYFVHVLFPFSPVDRFASSVLAQSPLSHDSPSHLSSLVSPSTATLKATLWTLFNPEIFHGPETFTTSGSSTEGFFEGWYYKMITKTGRTVVIIPGVIYHQTETQTKHPDSKFKKGFAFIMVADPGAHVDDPARYRLHKYPLAQFSVKGLEVDRGDWTVTIGASVFGPAKLVLDIPTHVRGTVILSRPVPWPASVLLPDVMGWFAWIPGMECRHGVVSLNSYMEGKLTMMGGWQGDEDGESISFEGGIAYIEKDWGSQFPRTWVWLQCNHFSEVQGVGNKESAMQRTPTTASLLLSIAAIPFPSDTREWTRFRGFLGGLWVNDKVYRFATYTGAVISSLKTWRGSDDDDDECTQGVAVSIRSAEHELRVVARAKGTPVLLHGPRPGGAFLPFVHEHLDVRVQVTLISRIDGEIIFMGDGRHAGLEVESMEAGGVALLETDDADSLSVDWLF